MAIEAAIVDPRYERALKMLQGTLDLPQTMNECRETILGPWDEFRKEHEVLIEKTMLAYAKSGRFSDIIACIGDCCHIIATAPDVVNRTWGERCMKYVRENYPPAKGGRTDGIDAYDALVAKKRLSEFPPMHDQFISLIGLRDAVTSHARWMALKLLSQSDSFPAIPGCDCPPLIQALSKLQRGQNAAAMETVDTAWPILKSFVPQDARKKVKSTRALPKFKLSNVWTGQGQSMSRPKLSKNLQTFGWKPSSANHYLGKCKVSEDSKSLCDKDKFKVAFKLFLQ